MISVTIVQILYIVLIISVVVLTAYLVVVLTRANAVLRDLQKVSGFAAKATDVVEGWGSKASTAAWGFLHYFADRTSDKKKGKK